MKRIQKGPVRGISLKIHEEEKEKLLDKAPEEPKIDFSKETEVTRGTRDMLLKIGQQDLLENNLVVVKQNQKS